MVPHFCTGKNKSDFFFVGEHYSLAQSIAVNRRTPRQAMRDGVSNQMVSPSRVLQTLYNPATHTCEDNQGTKNDNCASGATSVPTAQESALLKTLKTRPYSPLEFTGNTALGGKIADPGGKTIAHREQSMAATGRRHCRRPRTALVSISTQKNGNWPTVKGPKKIEIELWEESSSHENPA